MDLAITNSLNLVKYLEEVQKPGVARIVISHSEFVAYVNKIFEMSVQEKEPEDTWNDILMDFSSTMPKPTCITGCTHSPLTHVFDLFSKHLDS